MSTFKESIVNQIAELSNGEDIENKIQILRDNLNIELNDIQHAFKFLFALADIDHIKRLDIVKYTFFLNPRRIIFCRCDVKCKKWMISDEWSKTKVSKCFVCKCFMFRDHYEGRRCARCVESVKQKKSFWKKIMKGTI